MHFFILKGNRDILVQITSGKCSWCYSTTLETFLFILSTLNKNLQWIIRSFLGHKYCHAVEWYFTAGGAQDIKLSCFSLVAVQVDNLRVLGNIHPFSKREILMFRAAVSCCKVHNSCSVYLSRCCITLTETHYFVVRSKPWWVWLHEGLLKPDVVDYCDGEKRVF